MANDVTILDEPGENRISCPYLTARPTFCKNEGCLDCEVFVRKCEKALQYDDPHTALCDIIEQRPDLSQRQKDIATHLIKRGKGGFNGGR